MRTRCRRSIRGTTVLEVLMAIFVLMIGVMGIMTLFPIGVRLSQTSVDDAVGAMTAQNAIADIRTQVGLRDRVKPYATDNIGGDVLGCSDQATPVCNGVDTFGGSVKNVDSVNLGLTTIQFLPTVSGTAVTGGVPTAGLSVWLDANDSSNITVDGSNNVTAWKDKAGTGGGSFTPTANGPTSTSPVLQTPSGLNGQKAIYFNGSQHLSRADTGANSPIDITTQATFFAVVRVDGGTNQTVLSKMYGSSGGSYQYIWNVKNGVAPTKAMSLYDGSAWRNATVDFVSGFRIMELAWDATRPGTDKLRFFVNGDSAGTVNTSTSWVVGDQPIWIGRQGNDGNVLTGMIAEIIMYKAALSDADRQAVGGYLAQKYGITTTYPPPSSGQYDWLFTTKTGSGTDDCAVMLMTSGKSQWKPYRLDTGSSMPSVTAVSSAAHGTNFPADVAKEDTFILCGSRDVNRLWATAPAQFYGGPPYTLGKGASSEYGYLALINRIAGSTSAVKVYILIYKGYDAALPPESNEPAVACYATLLSTSLLR